MMSVKNNENHPCADEKVTERYDSGIWRCLTNPVKLNKKPSSKAKIVDHEYPLGRFNFENIASHRK